MPADPILPGPPAEFNVESRTVLEFRVEEEALRPILPAGWTPSPPTQGPSQGANLLVIFAERLLVQGADEQPIPGQSTNQIAVVALPVKPAGGYPAGVLIAMGLSAQKDGAPGPYGVFAPGSAEITRTFRAPSDEAHRTGESWSFDGGGGAHFDLQLTCVRGTPGRSQTQTVAYSFLDPNFHRTYYADQGADVLRSVPGGVDRVSGFEFHAKGADGSPFAPVLAGLSMPVSIISLPWTVRRAVIAPSALLLGLQSRDPEDFALPYTARQQTMWADSPCQPNENGVIEKDDTVWLDKPLPDGARGVCRVKLADGTLRYIAAAEVLKR